MGITTQLARSANFDLLYEPLASDLRRAIRVALDGDVVFDAGRTPLSIFRYAIDAAIRDIQHKRGQLLQRFIVEGPYECDGAIPPEMAGKRLTDDETRVAVSFIYSWMVNAFQGRLAELFAARAVLRLKLKLQEQGKIPGGASVYVGDAVTAPQRSKRGRFKAGDLHLLAPIRRRSSRSTIRVCAVGEIKSFRGGRSHVKQQIERHVARCRAGLVVQGVPYAGDQIEMGKGGPLLIEVRPGGWKLPRTFRLEDKDGRSFLFVDELTEVPASDQISPVSSGTCQITLRWSHEALAAAAYGMTFWYMERLGESVFTEPSRNPWPKMTPAEAGRNAATQALYHAIRRARDRGEHNRAVALYNVCGFGYALGMNYRNAQGRREMLWPEDLRVINDHGCSKEGFRIR